MIKLFAVDLDGCLSVPFKTPEWDTFSRIRDLNRISRTDPVIPAITICTGRPFPYAEAVAQWLDIYHPLVFENGGGIYHPVTTRLTWSPNLTEADLLEIRKVRNWVEHEVLPDFPASMIEFTKKTDIGVVSSDVREIDEMYPIISNYIKQNYDIFDIHCTGVSINVILKNCNKGNGLEQLSENTGIPLDAIAFMGDGTNDLPALLKVRLPYAPQNAREEVKKIARVIEKEATNAVLDAYQDIIRLNKEEDLD